MRFCEDKKKGIHTEILWKNRCASVADVLITVKESISNGHRIYSIELDEINKASERFEGLSDAAEKTADRATKTPHVDK